MTNNTTNDAIRLHWSNEPTITMTGGRALAEMLKLHDAGPMFGMGGFQLLPFYDSIAKLGLTHHLINDERTAIFACCAYAQVTGHPGICDATLGPGATNLVTGLAEALNAAIPLVVIAGDANREHSRKNMTQEGNQVDIMRPACKELIRVENTRRIPEAVRRAFTLATSGRPGPVVIDLPEDVCHTEFEFNTSDLFADQTTLRVPARRIVPPMQEIERAAKTIGAAKRPLLLVGGGIHLSRAYDALQKLAEAESIPVAHTMTGKGSMACNHPLSAGLFGRYTRTGNDLLEKADCLIVVGCKLGEIATKRYQLMPDNVPLIHMDSNADEFGRTTQATQCLWSDAREGLSALHDALKTGSSERRVRRESYTREVIDRMEEWRKETAERRLSEETPIHVARLIQEISDALPEDGILVADGGFAAHWTSLVQETTKAGRWYVADRGFASIGFGVPGALGAYLGAPGSAVVAVTGDGGFNMSMGDLETLMRANVPATIVVINNAASGYIKALQHAMYGGHYQSSDLTDMNFANIAEAMGCQGIRVEDTKDLRSAILAGIAETSRPTVIDVIVTRDPDRMLPAVDSRTLEIKKGDRPL